MRYLFYLSLILVFSCGSKSESKTLTADTIVNKAIEVSGGSKYGNSKVSFNFRNVAYLADRNNGQFTLARITVEDQDSIMDFISNDGFARFINDEFTEIPDSMALKYSASVNAVHYFSILPYGLQDDAVIKTLLGNEVIQGKNYHVIQVKFNQDGGGEDYEDVFVYWIEDQNYKVDYIAYSYNEDDGVGKRFRVAKNERYIEGLRFVDYDNYKPNNLAIPLERLAKSFEENQLEIVSKIDLENIRVNLIDN